MKGRDLSRAPKGKKSSRALAAGGMLVCRQELFNDSLRTVGSMDDEKILTSRPVTPEELALLNWLLKHGLPEARTFAPQLEKIRATPWCDCGCPSISLHVEVGAPLGTGSSRVISDVVGKTPDGKKIGILLFQKDRKLTLLESYLLDVIEGSWDFPVLNSLQTWESCGFPTIKVSKG
jgi:hypothetical protein